MLSADWMVSVPLSQLVELKNIVGVLDKLRAENTQLKNRVEGLHRTQYELMETILQLRKDVAHRA